MSAIVRRRLGLAAKGARWGWVLRLATLVLAFGVLAMPLVGEAQQPQVKVVRVLWQGSSVRTGFFSGLMKPLDHIEGRNLVLEIPILYCPLNEGRLALLPQVSPAIYRTVIADVDRNDYLVADEQFERDAV